MVLLAAALALGVTAVVGCGEEAQERLATCDQVCGAWARCGGAAAALDQCRVTCALGSRDPFQEQPRACAACLSGGGCPTGAGCAADCGGVVPGRLSTGASSGDGLIDEDVPGGFGPGIDDDGDGIDDDGDGLIDEDVPGFGLDDDGDGIDDDLDGFTDEDTFDFVP
jgi:hypothetical protein